MKPHRTTVYFASLFSSFCDWQNANSGNSQGFSSMKKNNWVSCSIPIVYFGKWKWIAVMGNGKYLNKPSDKEAEKKYFTCLTHSEAFTHMLV